MVLSSRASLDKSSIVSGYVSVMGVTLQHVYLQFYLLLLLLDARADATKIKEVNVTFRLDVCESNNFE